MSMEGSDGEGLNRGKTSRTEENLRGDMETKCNGNFLKYMKGILMKQPNDRRERDPIGHLLSTKEASSAQTSYIQLT